MADFNLAIPRILKNEGGYTNNPNDSGGETNWGITVAVARENGYKGNMRTMTVEQAKAIYKKKYWDTLELDLIKQQIIADIIFDISVNAGQGRAAHFLQRTVNLMTKQNIVEDGDVGNTTITRANTLTGQNIEKSVRIISALATSHYIDCCEKAEKNEDFILGWLRRGQGYLERLK